MDFLTAAGKVRPIRLSEKTRQFAWDSLNHKYGEDTNKTPCVNMDDIEGFSNLSRLEQYTLEVERIASQAPLRICSDEMVSGAATLGDSIIHRVPARLGGKLGFGAISHVTVDFETVLKGGMKAVRDNVVRCSSSNSNPNKKPFYDSCIRTLNAFDVWHERYLKALEGKPEYEKNLENLKKVPMNPAENFYEAVQSIWFCFAFMRLCGVWPGFGRLDVLLGSYLKKDLKSGVLTLDQAREILAHFFIKGCEWICGGDYGSGDAQHYQNIVIGGTDKDGNDVSNEVTYLILDIVEETGISDFPVSVRISSKTDEKLLRRVAEVIRLGDGTVALYNEELVIKSLTQYGYSFEEAVNFANDGCWEVQVPGKTYFTYVPFDGLRVLQTNTLHDYDGSVAFNSYEALFQAYSSNLKEAVENIFAIKAGWFRNNKEWNEQTPCTVVSLFERGCVEKGLSYLEGGPVYNVVSPHIGGLADIANALYAIKKFVFDEKHMSFDEFMKMLSANYEGYETQRRYLLNKYSYYGNDNPEVDAVAAEILDEFALHCKALDGRIGYMFPPGVSTFGRQIGWADERLAAPHGRKAHEVLSGNASPTPGTDTTGATAVICSYCRADLSKQVTGTALDVSLLPSSVKGEEGLEALVSLMKGFVNLNGYFMQLDVMNTEVLHKAQEHPEDFQTLSVRVSGWNARFVTLNKQWQDMIIERDSSGNTL